MNEDKVPESVAVVALRAEAYSADGESIIISLQTKYSTAERRYSIPIACFQDLIVDLNRLNASQEIAASPSDQAEPSSTPDFPIAAE